MASANFSKRACAVHARPWFLPLALAALLATAGFVARAQQSPLPPINAPGQIGPQPPVGSGGCSITAPSCADVAPTIIQSALGPSPLTQNVAHLSKILRSADANSPAGQQAIPWATQAFIDAGVDAARVESYPSPEPARGGISSPAGQSLPIRNVAAEIHGRDKASGFVILAARLDSAATGARALDAACDVALVIDAARAIHAAGAVPLRSIRFVLFAGSGRLPAGPLAYVRAHRSELDGADAVILYDAGDEAVTGYDLDGRPSLEAALRKDLAPAAPLGLLHDSFAARFGGAGFDFLLEGVPTIETDSRSDSHSPAKFDRSVLQHNVAWLALTAYSIADAPERLGRRQTRPEIEPLLARTGLENQMKQAGIWSNWEQRERGQR